MKKIYKLLSVAALVTVSSSTMVRAQEDVGELIKSSPADATKLAYAYLTPLFKGFGTGLTQGWYNTARPKGTARFDVRVSASLAIVPTSAQSYDVTKLGLSSKLSVKAGTGTMSPTVAGKEGSGPTLEVNDGAGHVVESFALPGGTGFSYVPAPQLQATIGLPKGIDVSVRYVPTIKLGEDGGKVDMVGGGLRLNIGQLMSKAKALPFNLALAGGFTKITYSLNLDVPPPSPTEATPKNASDVKDFTTQRVAADFRGVNADVILSKRLLFFTPYVSVGISNGKTDVGLLGNYPIITGGTVTGVTPAGDPVIAKYYETATDPIHIKETSISGVRGSVGFQMSLAIIKIYGSYNLGEYNSVNAGIGLGF